MIIKINSNSWIQKDSISWKRLMYNAMKKYLE